jgi:hypothetical protein
LIELRFYAQEPFEAGRKMPTHQIFVPTRARVSEVFERLPEEVKTSIREGSAVLARLSPAATEELLRSVRKVLTGFPQAATDELSAKLGQNSRDAEAALSTASAIGSIISVGEHSADEFVKAMVGAGLADESERKAVQELAERFAGQRSEFRAAQKRTAIASETLPSLRHFQTSLDIRLSRREGQLTAVPVVIVYIGTDSQTQKLWFQMSTEQLESFLEQLQKLHSDMQQAATFASVVEKTSE